jgi:hypothetical protein
MATRPVKMDRIPTKQKAETVAKQFKRDGCTNVKVSGSTGSYTVTATCPI